MNFKKKTLDRLDKEINNLGFKNENGLYKISLKEQSFAVLDLHEMEQVGNNTLRISPMIAFYEPSIIEFVRDNSEFEWENEKNPIMYFQLGFLTSNKKYREWNFENFKFSGLTINRFVNLLRDKVLTWLNSLKERETLLENLRNPNYSWQPSKIYFIPALLFIMGRTKEALEFADQELLNTGTVKKLDDSITYGSLTDALEAVKNAPLEKSEVNKFYATFVENLRNKQDHFVRN